MNQEDMIAVMCLSGFIQKENRIEQVRCLESISRHYGKGIARLVKAGLGHSV